jgi:membrane protein implicated in regulation of membrane protease activity
MEQLNEIVVWWHWVVAGLVLLLIEVATMTFLFAGFALAAFIVAITLLLVTMPFSMQLALWSLLAVVVFIKWRNLEARKRTPDVGQSDMGLQTRGTVTARIEAGGKGKVRFDMPVLGTSEWTATADETLEEGTRVRIADIRGQLIKVVKER